MGKWIVGGNMPCRWYFLFQSVYTDSSCPEQLWPRGPRRSLCPHRSLVQGGHQPSSGPVLKCLPMVALNKEASPGYILCSVWISSQLTKKEKEEEGEDAAKATWRVSHSRLAPPELCRGLATAENAGKMPANFRGSTLVGQQPRENEQLWFPSKQHMLFAGLFRTAVG